MNINTLETIQTITQEVPDTIVRAETTLNTIYDKKEGENLP
ncbi:hypothetical protein GGR08_001375 [Bartonella fuyuanensis]|uniref:Uncharacterized protein n=1 Tax=Bartonella fuyuanensis TaxID=1460968 RepID=A0A840E5K4_9HYPH|nr:hypothetical protein [Bartonella fuyuanensis]MBB4077059.1 hypothetical protein [Bartonella fuyuanensis]